MSMLRFYANNQPTALQARDLVICDLERREFRIYRPSIFQDLQSAHDPKKPEDPSRGSSRPLPFLTNDEMCRLFLAMLGAALNLKAIPLGRDYNRTEVRSFRFEAFEEVVQEGEKVTEPASISA